MDDIKKDTASLDVRNLRMKARNRLKWKAIVREAKVRFGLYCC